MSEENFNWTLNISFFQAGVISRAHRRVPVAKGYLGFAKMYLELLELLLELLLQLLLELLLQLLLLLLPSWLPRAW